MAKQREIITARVPQKLKKELERAAKEERRPLSNLMEVLLEEGLELRKLAETRKADGANFLTQPVTN